MYHTPAAGRVILCYFQHDVAPTRCPTFVRKLLDDAFPNRWIGRNDPIRWAARALDVPNRILFLWGYVKEEYNTTPVPNMNTWRERITLAVQSVTLQMLSNIRQSTD